MEAILEKKLEFDKSEWKPVKFGDVVREPKESIKDPEKAGVEHVVGLEHIEPEDIHLRSFKTLEESTTFTKAFKKGDVLFGRRRAYLKKAAMAEFDGICSGDITVFRAKENLYPGLLPFIVNNDKFFDWAVKHSAGGLSPRVKFKDIAKYEFLLPPKDQQGQLAELLWAMDDVVERTHSIFKKNSIANRSFQKEYLLKYYNVLADNIPYGYQLRKLEDIAEISGGSTPSRSNSDFWEGEIPWLTPTDVTNHNGILLSKTKEYITDAGLRNISNRLYPSGSILYCSRATIGYAIINEVPMATNQGFSNFIVNEKVNNFYLYYLLRHLTPDLTRLAGGSTFLEISKSAIRKFKVLIPSLDFQEQLVEKLNQFETNRLQIEAQISESKRLMSSIINEIF